MQVSRLDQLLRAIRDNPFYSAKLSGIGTDASLTDPPFTTKQELIDDQLAHPPYGSNLTYPLDRDTRISQTSGTTSGTPLRWLDTPESCAWMAGNWARVYQAACVGRGDRFLFAFSFRTVPGILGGFRGRRAGGRHGHSRRRYAHRGALADHCRNLRHGALLHSHLCHPDGGSGGGRGH